MFSKHTSGTTRKRIIFFLGTLLAVNAIVAHIITNQITNASNAYQVKDEHVVVEEAVAEEDNNTDAQEKDASSITIYAVKQGDTISSIAKKFGVSENTVLWANELTRKSVIKIGQNLVILPVSGVRYKVTKGDTISGIAKKFDADEKEILYFNDLDDPKNIKPGLELIIPGADPLPAKTVSVPKKPTTPKPSTPSNVPLSDIGTEGNTKSVDNSEEEKKDDDGQNQTTDPSSKRGEFIVPAPGSVLTQRYHAVNAVDFGNKVGSPILSAAKGTVIVSKSGCGPGSSRNRCNGGFGNFIVISHDGGIQTLYAHLSKVTVSVGDSVDQGEQIGLMGNSGRSTGSHLHFETHGISNPFARDKKLTQY